MWNDCIMQHTMAKSLQHAFVLVLLLQRISCFDSFDLVNKVDWLFFSSVVFVLIRLKFFLRHSFGIAIATFSKNFVRSNWLSPVCGKMVIDSAAKLSDRLCVRKRIKAAELDWIWIYLWRNHRFQSEITFGQFGFCIRELRFSNYFIQLKEFH